jgi:glycosyltransferase involved in cell wall biosynthesis
VRILVATARFPEAGGKGDQSRTASLIANWSERHEVTVVASSPPQPGALVELERHATVEVHAAGAVRRAAGAAATLVRLRPGQVGWMMTARAWRRTTELARAHDVVVFNTIRSVRALPDGPGVLDHVDALSLNMVRRAHGPEPWIIRAAAAVEARLLRRWERLVAPRVAAQVVTSPEDAGALPPGADPWVLPVAWDGELSDGGGRRDIDVIFTGTMSYPPNRTAAARFAHEIVPRLRAVRPDLRAVVAGRKADGLGLDGVEVMSDVADLHAVLRRARVAIAPLSGGTGTPYKVVEAAALGAAVVATPWAARALELPVAVAETDETFASEAARLLDDETARLRAVGLATTRLRELSAPSIARAFEEVLKSAVRQRDRAPANAESAAAYTRR